MHSGPVCEHSSPAERGPRPGQHEGCCLQVWNLLHPARERQAPAGWWCKPPARPAYNGPVMAGLAQTPKKAASTSKPAAAVSAGAAQHRPAKRAKVDAPASKLGVASAGRPPSAHKRAALPRASALQVRGT